MTTTVILRFRAPPGSWGSGLRTLAITVALTAAAMVLVTIAARKLETRRLIRETEAYLRDSAGETV